MLTPMLAKVYCAGKKYYITQLIVFIIIYLFIYPIIQKQMCGDICLVLEFR